MADEKIILLAEDMEDDAFLSQRALKAAGINHRCVHVSNGAECIAYLEGTGPYQDREKFPVPSLLLLDLKMPLVSGFEVLDWLQKQPGYKELPVIILSGSEWAQDRTRALNSGAKDYHIKPLNAHDLMAVMEAIGTRWLRPPAGS